MSHPSQQPGFDPNQPPPQDPGQPGEPPVPPPGYAPPPYGGMPPAPRRRPRTGAVFAIVFGSMALIIVVGLVIGRVAGDGPSSSDTPEEVVEQYLDAMASVWRDKEFHDPAATADRLAPYLCSDIREEMSAAV